MVRVLAVILSLASAVRVQAADHPPWKELAPLLSQPIDSNEVRAFVEKHHLRKSHKVDSGAFTSLDQAYSLMFRENRISTIILRVAPWPEGSGDANWTVYNRDLPGKLRTEDRRTDVLRKLGEPTKPGSDRWIERPILLWVHFGDDDSVIDELYVSAAPVKP